MGRCYDWRYCGYPFGHVRNRISLLVNRIPKQMKKLIRVADVYPAFKEYAAEQITFSRFVEIINEAANKNLDELNRGVR